MKIIITAATKNEWMQASKQIAALSKVNKPKHQIIFHQSGVGMLSTAVSLMKVIASEKPNFIIQVGIAGTFNSSQSLAKVFVIKQESIGDLGVTEKGNIITIEGNTNPGGSRDGYGVFVRVRELWQVSKVIRLIEQ